MLYELYAGKDEVVMKLKLLDWNSGSHYSKRSSVKKIPQNRMTDLMSIIISNFAISENVSKCGAVIGSPVVKDQTQIPLSILLWSFLNNDNENN